MKVGSIIKIERLRQEMKQETLAKDICSVSYLSRIENNLTFPSDDILYQLQDKLGVVLKAESISIGIDIEHEIRTLQQFFREIIDTRDKEEASKMIETLSVKREMTVYKHFFLEISQMELRLRLMFKNEVKEVLENTRKLKMMGNTLSSIHHFRILVIEGIAKYICGENKLSLALFNRASLLLDEVLIHESEIADFYYVTAIASVGENQLYAAMEYSNRAINYFQRELLANRAVECLIISGVAYKQLNRFEDSVAQFQRAERLCDQAGLENFRGMLYQNLGAVYSVKGDSEKAISYFERALGEKKTPDDLIITLFSIVKEYTKSNNNHNTLGRLQEAFDLLSNVSEEKRTKFMHHFNVYKALNKKDDVLLVQSSLAALTFFEDNQNYKYCYKYGVLLADTYAEQKKYKKAVLYYQKCFQYMLKQKEMTRWEDLT